MSPPQPLRKSFAPRAARAGRRLQMLQELADLGMTLARSVAGRAMEPATDPATVADLGLAFTRIARAVRQTVALEIRLEDERLRVQTEQTARLAAETRARGARRKRLVEGAVERVIESEVHGKAAEDLLGDLYERLADPSDDADFADRPIGEMIARICQQLGVTPDPRLWEDEDWALEEARRARGIQRRARCDDDGAADEVSGSDLSRPPPPRRRLN